MKKKIRIKDIADRAGVSTGTVDRVLHDRGNVAPKVREKVLAVIKELGYKRNMIASALAYNKNIQVAGLLPDPEKDPFWEQVHTGVLRASESVQHYGLSTTLIYFDQFSDKSFIDRAQKLLEKNIDGLLFPPLFAQKAGWLLEECKRKNVHAITINTNIRRGDPLCYIGQDSYQSGVLGARLLDFGLSAGQTVGIINFEFSTKAALHLQEKERGFKDYFKDNEKDITIFRIDFKHFNDSDAVVHLMRQLLEDYPQLAGLFVANSRAHLVVESLQAIGAKGVKIVGFDLIEQNLRYLKNNQINFLINQNPLEQGFLGLVSFFKYLILKEPVEKTQYLPLDIVVKENVNYYLSKQVSFELAL